MIQKVIRFFQWLPVLTLIVVEYMSSYYPLVMRHLYTKKLLYSKYLSSEVLLGISVIVIGLLIWRFVRSKEWKGLLIVTLLTLLFIWLPQSKDLLTYSYGVTICLYVYIVELMIHIKKRAI